MTPTLAPMAWTQFTLAPQPSKADWLAIINRVVNHGIDPSSDPLPPVGKETWSIWPRVGWCHDYAVTKRAELMLRGYAASECLLAEVQLPDGEYHMVLVVNGLTLDNLREEILPWPQYELVKMQSTDNPDQWTGL